MRPLIKKENYMSLNIKVLELLLSTPHIQLDSKKIMVKTQ